MGRGGKCSRAVDSDRAAGLTFPVSIMSAPAAIVRTKSAASQMLFLKISDPSNEEAG